jgi:hypothetical protein
MTVAHELGHNLGVWHASSDTNNDGTQDNEYGDNSCLMGNAKNWRGMNAPHRVALNWIDTSNVLEFEGKCSESGIYTLSSLHVAPRPGAGAITNVILFPRSGGGDYYVSLRGSEGYDTHLGPLWSDKVTVHYHFEHTTIRQTNSQLVTLVTAGSEWTDEGHVAISLIEQDPNDKSSVRIGLDFCGDPAQFRDWGALLEEERKANPSSPAADPSSTTADPSITTADPSSTAADTTTAATTTLTITPVTTEKTTTMTSVSSASATHLARAPQPQRYTPCASRSRFCRSPIQLLA